MKQHKYLLALLAAGCVLGGSTTTNAAVYHITVDTSALSAPAVAGSAPFSLDFQFNNGVLLGNNTATVSNFNFGGGSALGSATAFDGAAGSLGSSITFDNTSAFQELFQAFTPGSTLSFDISLTQNVDGLTPDAFAFSILDNNTANIPTDAAFGDDTLLHADITTTDPLTLAQLNLASGTGDFADVKLTAVPEPGFALGGLVLVAFCGYEMFGRRRNRGVVAA